MTLVYARGNLSGDSSIWLLLAVVLGTSAQDLTGGESAEVALEDVALGGFDRSEVRALLINI